MFPVFAKKFRTHAVTISCLLVLSGCESSSQSIERHEDHLAAAGFAFHPADNAKRQAMLNTLPSHKFIRRSHNGKLFYVYSDPTVCDCLYVGDERAYENYRQYRQQKAALEQQEATAMDYENPSWNWGTWGAGPEWGGWNPSWGNWDPGMGGGPFGW